MSTGHIYIDYYADRENKNTFKFDRPEADEIDDYDKYIGATCLLDPVCNSDNDVL